MTDILPNYSSWQDWSDWASQHIVTPVKREILGPITENLTNLRFPVIAALINHPHAPLQTLIKGSITLETLSSYRIVQAIHGSGAPAITEMLDDYLARLDSVELAVSSLLGRQLPIVEAISNDLHTLLGTAAAPGSDRDPAKEFPAALLALYDEVSGAFENMLSGLGLIAGKGRTSTNTFDFAPGHFYAWVCCTTEVDKQIKTDEERKIQQRLRHSMMKVIVSYVDGVDISPARFRGDARVGGDGKTFGGFPVSSTSHDAILSNANAKIRAYAGVWAAAFEHAFVSSRPLTAQGPGGSGDLYHDLPLTLKMQRPDLYQLTSAHAPFPDLNLNVDSEFLAMRLAMTSASLTAGAIHAAVNCLGNGVWEISPNNPPLVDTIARLVAIPIYELEKAILYDVFRRFRIYVTDKPLDTSNQWVLMQTTMSVPDFSTAAATEKQITAAVAVTPGDKLLDAARDLLGPLPFSPDVEHQIDPKKKLAGLLYGTMKDSLAAGCVLSS